MKRPLFTALSAVLAGLLFQSCRPAAPEAREAAAELPPEVVQPAAEAPAARPLWPHDESDLEPDPAVQWGVLPNGLRYALMRHTEPPERVSLRLYVRAGSLMETDEQQGLAHFLEHMAFNGTEHFAAGELVEYFQRLGMGFGNDTNAHTGFDETVYDVELPGSGDELLKDAFTLLRDYATNMLLQPGEIDEERGVILAEKRYRNSVEYRMMLDGLNFSLPESRIPARMPIGDEAVIANAGRERFTAFYNTWYTPDRMMVAVVGDIEPARFEALIQQYFGDIQAPAEPPADPDLGRIEERGVQARVYREAEASGVSVDISYVGRFDKGPDSTARRANELTLSAAKAMLNRRLQILSREEDAPFISGSAYSYDWLDFVDSAGITLECQPEDWRGALRVAEQELRRALEHGFSEAELAEARANLLNGFREAALRAATRKSGALANELVGAASVGNVFTSPAQELALAESVLEAMTPEDAHRALVEAWEGDTRLIHISGNLPEVATDDLALATYNESRAVAVEAPAAAEASEFAYGSFGEPGTVTSRTEVEDLGITQLRLSNNVYVNLKPTDFEDNVIRLLARFGGGLLEAPADKPGLPLLASSTFIAGGLQAHSADDLARIFAGKTVGVDFEVDNDAFTLSGTSNMLDLESQLDLMAAYLTAPGYRDEALRQARRSLPQLYIQLRNTPQGVMQDRVASYLASGDPRFGFPPEDAVMERDLGELREWLATPLSGSRLELSLVGDFEVEAVIPLLLRTFGALPERAADKPDFAAARLVSFPQPPAEPHVIRYTSEIPKAVDLTVWPTTDQWDISRTRRLSVLAAVMDDRLRIKVREELGADYGPQAYSYASDTFEDYGDLVALMMVDPSRADELVNVGREIGAELLASGTTQDELERMIKPLLEQITQWRRNNRYWLGSVLASSQEHPVRLDWARSMVDDLKSITVEDINSLAREYLQPERAIRISIVPVTE